MVISYWLLVISVTERRADRGIFVVAVIAVVACNACNARIAGHCKQEGVCATCNDVVVCPSRSSIVIGHWSFGSKMDCAAVRCAGGWGYERNRKR